MGLEERVRGALEKMGMGKKKTAGLTSGGLGAAGVPPLIQRLGQRAEGLPKATPLNLRKLAETPVPRKAINTIKDRIACMQWRVRVKQSRVAGHGWRAEATTETRRHGEGQQPHRG